jgi:outer membrane cobalamin receptor
MSMGYSANSCQSIDSDFVREIVGDELYESFIKLADDLSNSDITYLFSTEEYEDVEEDDDNFAICQIYKQLKQRFDRKTDLRLTYNYHDSDSVYDDISGAFWSVDDVYVLSEAGKKYKKHIQTVNFVTFG